jgi:hypothetical protein
MNSGRVRLGRFAAAKSLGRIGRRCPAESVNKTSCSRFIQQPSTPTEMLNMS